MFDVFKTAGSSERPCPSDITVRVTCHECPSSNLTHQPTGSWLCQSTSSNCTTAYRSPAPTTSYSPPNYTRRSRAQRISGSIHRTSHPPVRQLHSPQSPVSQQQQQKLRSEPITGFSASGNSGRHFKAINCTPPKSLYTRNKTPPIITFITSSSFTACCGHSPPRARSAASPQSAGDRAQSSLPSSGYRQSPAGLG